MRQCHFRLFWFPPLSFFLFSSYSLSLSLSDSSYVLCCSDEVSIISDYLVSASSKVITLHAHSGGSGTPFFLTTTQPRPSSFSTSSQPSLTFIAHGLHLNGQTHSDNSLRPQEVISHHRNVSTTFTPLCWQTRGGVWVWRTRGSSWFRSLCRLSSSLSSSASSIARTLHLPAPLHHSLSTHPHAVDTCQRSACSSQRNV